jgi:hypothetical protein
MRKFIFKLFIISSFLFCIFTIYSTVRLEITYNNPYSKYSLTLNGKEIIKAIYKSKKTKKIKKLLIGDSVAEQIYSVDNYNDSIYSLTCNQAITLAGQYCLLYTFLNNNKDNLPQEIILYYNPFSLQNNLDKFAFHYFLKTFYYNNTFEDLLNNDIIKNRIQHIPYFYIAKFNIIKSINYSPIYSLKNDASKLVSPISELYLNKIDSLCNAYKVPLKFLPSPIRISRKQEIENLKPRGNKLIDEYYSKIIFMNDSLFQDPVHFKKEYIPSDPLKLI